MFLMNAPPVVALQSKWEAFGTPGGFRFPGGFAEPHEGVARASVSARVRMVISTLQSHEAALGMSNELALQRSQRAERGRDARLATNPAFAACGLAADFAPSREEEAAAFGPLVLDSDSDDSVDRDIEEAIQEYLKAKGGAAQPSGAADADGGRRCRPEVPRSSAPTAPCPPKLAPSSGGAPGSRGRAGRDRGSASPASVSSDDSFEHSIQAEIEQFLNEKRQHETPRGDVSVDTKPEPGDNPARPAFRSSKELAVRAHRAPGVTGACRDFLFRKPPRLSRVSTRPRGLGSKAAGEPAEAARNKGTVRRSAGPGRRAKRPKSTAPVPEASGSSSDDGIEEAIQLYQLEKRKEASGDPPQRAPFAEGRGPDPPPRGTSHSTKSASPETHRKTPSRKKPAAPKAVDLRPGGPAPDPPSRPPREPRAAEDELAERPPCGAETSAELMCAEAILDISKTILPAPVGGGESPPPASPLSYPLALPARSDGDSSSVDSNDSIEQEIRTFLALKAQSGGWLATTESRPQSTQSPPPSPGPGVPVSKTLGLSLSCRRKRRGGSNAVRPSTPKKTRETVQEGAQAADHGPGNAQPGRAPRTEGETRGQPLSCRPLELGEQHGGPDARGGGWPGHGKAAAVRSTGGKGSSEDKSSSLDSDEDLDTAIKDLLRSRRRLRRRWKDPRAACKRKVRFSTTETQCVDKLGGCQKDWKDKSPPLLKSCLSKPKKDSRENQVKTTLSVSCRETERTRADGTGTADAPPVLQSRRKASEGNSFCGDAEACELQGAGPSPGPPPDDSSSVDSDDSIELEIRRFLAEKAKESGSGSEALGGGPAAPGTRSMPRPELPCQKVSTPALALQPGVCTQSQRGRGGPGGTGRAFLPGGRSGPLAEQACLPAALARRTGTAGALSARGSAAGRRLVCTHRDQSPRGAGGARERALGPPPTHVEAGVRMESPGAAFAVTTRGRSPRTHKPGADGLGGPQTGLALPWADFAHQSRLQSAWALSPEGREAVWRGGLGGQRDQGPEGQDPKKGLPFAGFSSLLSTQLFHFGKSVSWGGKQAGVFSPPLSLPLQGPSFSAFRDTPAGHSPVSGGSRLLTKKEGGRWPSQKSQAACTLHARRNSGSEDDGLDLRYRRGAVGGEDEAREAVGSDSSELSDTSVEEGGGPAAKGKALQP
ncbi:protein phosphatase 1 regulatory subunit 26 [Neofelis nebulosa]|uniref:protein phosphatase 1 regulatory subunit 26 n=1 Tax=Neofelis nebulosa TaxID=61452 RepID=UPI00272B2D6A|nr:protein phosphatase 1 regulatory subunit 26 [Neofelis nebulosa]XP_058549623.1 protein phosphatase 1 regulatory subunit 26 [Neofelis nebulosa]XP_058549624.1 protein phosphatase 1 regulatory subunit 26 [Neofelis nebulosa]XP_058549625.1 protein phosphatase 1 regulatory subunit 26 [Neofelis nebulosa]XP_058549626.1 protein phosphatase 1 regulatory subunit 26 [Neofelis nebulosa]XP_058549627.1 protein phosphatase 1 regulatory subunit 26 [Neofelis nebulosa]XP_058549628.1 protein phosphatase 1 regu